MGFRKPSETKVKVGKLDFVTVAKKAGVSGISNKKFQDKAGEALHRAGFNKSDIKGILSGNREMEHSTLKNVFRALHKAKITTRGGGAVKEYISKEKNRQLRLVRKHLRERADEIKEETDKKKLEASDEVKKKEGSSGGSNTTSGFIGTVKKVKSISDSGHVSIRSGALSGAKGKSVKNVVLMPEQDEEIKSLLEEAESHDLPID